MILARAELVEPKTEIKLCRDSKDNFLLEVAATAHANYLVIGDKDLLDDEVLKSRMREIYGVKVVNVVEFLQMT